jgi:hypothetical protein
MKKIIKQEQWVMLPTESPDSPIIKTEGGFIINIFNDVNLGNHQHLYLTSDEEIKEGDWYLDTTLILKNSLDDLEEEIIGKIIATTDKSLMKQASVGKQLDVEAFEFLTQIPESFIKYYVEKQGEVGDVELELEKDNYYYNARVIIPKEEEKMYSRDDMFPYIFKAMSDCMDEFHPHDDLEPFVTKWIKENL